MIWLICMVPNLAAASFGGGWRNTVSATIGVHAPVALTSARAVTT